MSAHKNSMMSEVISYTPPKLYTGKTGKDWYIGFKAFDPVVGDLRLKRIKLNHIEKISDRRKYAADLITRLHNQLRIGWNPWIAQSGDSKGLALLSEVCDRYRKYIDRLFSDGVIRHDTYVGYVSYLRNFLKYNDSQKPPITYIYQLSKSFISEFLDYIYIERENSPQTRNNYLTWLRVFAGWLVKHGYTEHKLTDGIDNISKRSIKKERKLIEMGELVQLHKYLDCHNKHYLLACYLLFYCFVRPKEISYIKINDFSIKSGTLRLHADNSKNKKDAVITLPNKVLKLLVDLNIFSYPGDYYLFSNGFTPGREFRDSKQFRDYWIRFIRKSLKFPTYNKFYSLKDTGVTAMLRARIDNISVRDQARHSSILITDIYTPHDIEQANPIIQKFDTVF